MKSCHHMKKSEEGEDRNFQDIKAFYLICHRLELQKL